MVTCLVCGKEFEINDAYLKRFGGSMARHQLCSWACYNISIKVGGEVMNKQYEDLQRGRFKPLKEAGK
jgi:hypothetical protein